MKLTFLGTGTSFGVPVVGCACPTCTSDDPRDRRSRSAALLSTPDVRILVDTPPELRLQLLAAGVSSIDAVWVTHTHADHVHGLDDLRIFSLRRGHPVPTWLSEKHAMELRRRFSYVFDPEVRVPRGTSKPQIELKIFRTGEEVEVAGESFTPVEVPHGSETVYGFRTGGLGYVTDGKLLPPATVEALRGVRVLVLNALWFGNPHPTHFNVEEAVEAARRVGAERTYLVHLTHRVGHRELLDRLPDGIEPAYDGLTVEI